MKGFQVEVTLRMVREPFSKQHGTDGVGRDAVTSSLSDFLSGLFKGFILPGTAAVRMDGWMDG